MNKAKLLLTLWTKRAELDAVLAEIPADQMAKPGVAGEWSVKDIVAHLAYHERWTADRLREALRGETYTPTVLDGTGVDERNEMVFRQNHHRPVEDVLAESRQTFQRLIEAAQAHYEEFLIEPQRLEGAQGPVTVWKFLRGEVYEHYGQHLPSIREWLASRRAS